MNRREFLGIVGVSGLAGIKLPEFGEVLDGAAISASAPGSPAAATGGAKAYGSGYFGEWITDQFGLDRKSVV